MQREQIIAQALEEAKSLAAGTHILQGKMLSRSHRELLVSTGWLQEIIRGWYMLVRPDISTGDTAAWYSNFWDFLRLYLHERFGENYCLSAESSLDLHMERTTIPKQLVVIARHGGGLTKLMHGLSLMVYVEQEKFPEEVARKKLNVMTLPYALCKVSPAFFQKNPREAELALRSVSNASDLIRLLVRYNLKSAGARIVGAYHHLGEIEMAAEIQAGLQQVGVKVVSTNPFKKVAPLLGSGRVISPYAARIKAMWAEARIDVENSFPPPGQPKKGEQYLKAVDEIYQYDAYNSLSIEGYHVDAALIEKVKSSNWRPDSSDREAKDAMAARGYFDTFQLIKAAIAEIIQGEDAAHLVEKNLQTWYQALFGPSIQAGILPADALFGYRNDRVFIRNSIHSPPPKEAVPDAMKAFFECLKSESHLGVRAVLGHYFFVHIHPYMDGNGRIARFLMNVLLAEGGYPWVVVRVKNRKKYIDTLEVTHHHFNLKAFSVFIKEEMTNV